MSELHYGVNVENLLYDLSQHESDDIDEFDFYCEDEQGREGCATIDITLLAADALKVIASIKAERDALAAENAALKSERTEMAAIGELIRTQDNRITDQPFFAVMTKREMVGSEDHDYDRICWVENQSGDYVEATETQHRRLEAIYQGKYEVREGWDRYAMKEIDVFVTGCFTEQGCKDYINRNSHNLNKPFIYAFGSYRNNEYQAVRKFIMDIPETPATDAYLNAVRAEGIIMFASKQLAAAGALESTITLERLMLDAGEFAGQLRAGKDGWDE